MEKDAAVKPKRPMAIRITLGVIALFLYLGIFFWIAGRLDWTKGWLFIALLVCGQSINFFYLRRRNPDVLKYLARIGENTKKWDKLWLIVFTILYMAIIYIAALDGGRHGWSRMPGWSWIVGAALYLVFMSLVTWAMAVNPHFENTVRIQHDRGHKVVDTGPYRIVRHPGYTGTILGFFLSPPFLLGSWWAMVPALLSTAWLIFRTAMEDRTLRLELEGYKEYSKRVKYRLIPLVW